MNQIMLLFTIATILYLPPSFIAVSSWNAYSKSSKMNRALWHS